MQNTVATVLVRMRCVRYGIRLAIMEVLLEIESSRKCLVGVTEETLVSAVEQELSVLGDVAIQAFTILRSVKGLLQRWSDR